MVNNPNSASAASTHSPAEPEEKRLNGVTETPNIDPIKENGLQNLGNTNNSEANIFQPTGFNFPDNALTKVEDCNSSRESIDVESTQPEDIKVFPNINTTTHANSDTKPLVPAETAESSSAIQTSMIKQEEVQPEVDWSLYHLGDMTLEMWLQAIRKHVLMSLIRHPK